MPDYEIRLFHADGSLALVHMSHLDSDDEAHAYAKRLLNDLSRYEISRGGTAVKDKS